MEPDIFGLMNQASLYNLQPSQQNAGRGRGDSLSVSDGEQDVKMVRNGTDVMKHTEVVNEVIGFTPLSLLESDLTQGMKEPTF